jgi:methylmalonyl-CoA mutase
VTRREPITGTSEFPNINEADVAVLMAAPDAPQRSGSAPASASTSVTETSFPALIQMAGQGASLSQLATTAAGSATDAIAPLPSLRTAEPFEQLRDLSDTHLARTRTRPQVFLVNLGPIAAFTARATFAKNFFEAGGAVTIASDGLGSVDEILAAFALSGAQTACLCSSDEIYFDAAEAAIVPHETFAEEAARALRQAGCEQVYMAGRPIMREEALRWSGIHDFIYTGCDHLRALRAIYTSPDHRSLRFPAEAQP